MTVVDLKALARLTERNPLAVAIALSLVIHLGLFGGWQLSKQLGWLQHTPTWLTALTRKLATPAKARQKQADQERSIPMTFVEVNPDTVTAEPPENAKYYSSKNSKAANPDPKEQKAVKVDGKQDQVVRLMDNEKPKPFPLQPSPSKPPEPLVEPKPKNEAPGDLALVRPRDPKPSDGQVDTGTGQAKGRPRNLAEARAKAMLSGQTMKQEGGASNLGKVAFDTKATPFGDYDLALISAVERAWHMAIENHEGTKRPGKVVVDFRLLPDGRVTEIKILDNEVSEIQAMLCHSAILNPAPYLRWPTAMRQTIGNYRDIRFTFYYN
jgi:outer membrane biosynthesis protein TonB